MNDVKEMEAVEPDSGPDFADDDSIVVLLVGRDGEPFDPNKNYKATNPFED